MHQDRFWLSRRRSEAYSEGDSEGLGERVPQDGPRISNPHQIWDKRSLPPLPSLLVAFPFSILDVLSLFPCTPFPPQLPIQLELAFSICAVEAQLWLPSFLAQAQLPVRSASHSHPAHSIVWTHLYCRSLPVCAQQVSARGRRTDWHKLYFAICSKAAWAQGK